MNTGLKESRNASSVPFFSIRKVFELAGKLEREGREVIHLEIGRPDFDTPPPIKDAAAEALRAGEVHYTSNRGLPELRSAIERSLRETRGVAYDSDAEVIVTVGGSEALFLIFAAYLDPGDEVLVPTPCYPTYLSLPALFGARAVPVPYVSADGYYDDAQVLAERITPRTKLLLVNSPCNPTGVVWTERAFRIAAGLAKQHDLLVVSDEVYEKFVYDGATHSSIASLAGMRERTLIVNSTSKTFSMTGWRVGYVAGPQNLVDPVLRVHQYNTACAASFAQHGAVRAFEAGAPWVKEMVAEFDRRRRLVQGALASIPGVNCPSARGAFYLFPDLSAFGLSSEEMTHYLLDRAGVAVVPGSSFGEGGEGHVRISYAIGAEVLEQAVRRICDALARL